MDRKCPWLPSVVPQHWACCFVYWAISDLQPQWMGMGLWVDNRVAPNSNGLSSCSLKRLFLRILYFQKSISGYGAKLFKDPKDVMVLDPRIDQLQNSDPSAAMIFCPTSQKKELSWHYPSIQQIFYLVGGLEHDFYDIPFTWECHHTK